MAGAEAAGSKDTSVSPLAPAHAPPSPRRGRAKRVIRANFSFFPKGAIFAKMTKFS